VLLPQSAAHRPTDSPLPEKQTVYRLLNEYNLPALRIGGQRRFQADLIEGWLQKESTPVGVKVYDSGAFSCGAVRPLPGDCAAAATGATSQNFCRRASLPFWPP